MVLSLARLCVVWPPRPVAFPNESLGLRGISCSAMLRCRRPDGDPSFMRVRAERLRAWGMGARGATRPRSCRRVSGLGYASRGGLPASLQPTAAGCFPSLLLGGPLSCPVAIRWFARAAYPPRGGHVGVPCASSEPLAFAAAGGGPPSALERAWSGVPPWPPVPSGRSGLRGLSRMRWIYRSGGPPPPHPCPQCGRPWLPAGMRRCPACPCVLPPQDGGTAGAGFRRRWRTCATWLILPVVICLSQRLSHACVSMN